MDRDRVTLSAGEWRVMEVLWTGPRTLMELVRELSGSAGWAKSTVTTVVRRMEEKGLLRVAQEGRAKVFSPAFPREEAAAAETESLLERAYRGSVGLMMSALVRRGGLNQKDLDELHAILDRAEVEDK